MKKRDYLWSLLTLVMVTMLSISFVSCSKDDEDDDLEQTENISAQDPEGTIVLNMTSGASENYYKIGDICRIHVDAANNFRGEENSSAKIDFVTIGKVDGLAKITQIPTTGWAESAAVVPGTGYVMRYYYNNDVQYARIYVVDYLTTSTTDEFGNTTGTNSGATVKYQAPFYGCDESIQIDETSLTFDAKGGSQSLVLNNKNVISFNVSSSESWCRVGKSVGQGNTYYNTITISVSASKLPDARTAIVTLTTAYDKATTITVTQSGVEPYIMSTEKKVNLSGGATTREVGINTNYDIDNIDISGTTEWCKAELHDLTTKMQEKAAIAKLTRSGNDFSAQSYQLWLVVDTNNNGDSRTAKITLTSKDKKASEEILVTQSGASITLDQSSIYVEANSGSTYVFFNSIIEPNNLKIECDSAWCHPNINYQYYNSYSSSYDYRAYINYNQNINGKSRTAIIKISSKSGNLSATITLTQQGDVITLGGDAGKTLSAAKQNTTFSYNCYAGVENLKVKSNVDWCSPTINNGYVNVEVDNNSSDVARVAKITLSHRNEDSGVQYTITQEGIKVTMPDTLWYDKNSHIDTKSISVNLSDFKGWDVSSSEDWCKPSMNKKELTLRLSATTEDRVATISFEGITKTIKVVQSKYAVGDEYREGEINGTVGYMKDNTRYIYKIVGNEVWSNENVLVGASNSNDGMENMAVIRKLPDWKENYPSFALCDALNTAKVKGWYMPSINELIQLELLSYSCWSSTEFSNYYAHSNVGGTWNKNQKKDIVAVRKF